MKATFTSMLDKYLIIGPQEYLENNFTSFLSDLMMVD
jgi:hypothetical protein